jgi:hypothetical protein
MGTKEKELKKYLKLWDTFETKLKKQGLNLSSFAKKWEKSSKAIGANDYNKIYERLKKQRSRKNGLKSVRPESINQIVEYIKFIDDDWKPFEAFDDEKLSDSLLSNLLD